MSWWDKLMGRSLQTVEKSEEIKEHQETARTPDFRERATAVDDIYQNWRMINYNPDDLAATKGGLRIYKEMGKDEQVKACLALKKAAIVGRGWEIKGENQEHVDFINYVLKDARGTVDRTVGSILSAFQYGFSIHEKVYKMIDEGNYHGKIGLEALKQKSPTSFKFDVDKYGNLKETGLIQEQEMGAQVRLPIDKFIIFSYAKEFNNFYGESDLYSAYRSWFIKDKVIKYWGVYLERGAIPVPYAQAVEGRTLDADQVSALNTILKRLTAGSSMVLPDGVDVDLFGGDSNRPISYENAIALFDLRIARAILIPTMIGYTDMEKGGAYSQSATHYDTFEHVLAMTTSDLEEEAFQEQVIKDLIDKNYGVQNTYPQFKFKPMSEEKKRELVSIWSNAVVRGAVTPTEKDELYLREIMGLPDFEEGEIEKIRQERAKEVPGFQGKPLPPNAKSEMFTDMFDETVLTKKINYRKYIEALDGLEDEAKRELSEVFDETINALIEDVKKKSIIQNG